MHIPLPHIHTFITTCKQRFKTQLIIPLPLPLWGCFLLLLYTPQAWRVFQTHLFVILRRSKEILYFLREKKLISSHQTVFLGFIGYFQQKYEGSQCFLGGSILPIKSTLSRSMILKLCKSFSETLMERHTFPKITEH